MRKIGLLLLLATVLGAGLGGCVYYTPPGYYYYDGGYRYHPGGVYPLSPYPYPPPSH